MPIDYITRGYKIMKKTFAKITVKQATEIATLENAYLNSFYDTNTSKKLKTIDRLVTLLNGLNADTTFTNVEMASNATTNVKRQHDFYNIGTIVEQIIKAYIHDADKKQILKKAVASGYDMVVDGKRYEIKSCIGNNSKNTAVKSSNYNVCLINNKGVWLIDKNDIESLTDDYGRFKANQVYATPFKALADMMGY